MICQDLSLLCLCLLFNAFALAATDQWTTMEEESQGNLSVKLEVREQANPSMEEWLGLTLINHGDKDLAIEQAYYRLELRAYEGKNKAPIKTGQFSAATPADFTGRSPVPSLVAVPTLAPGTTLTRSSISVQAAALLGYPSKAPMKVRALLYLDLQVADKKSTRIEWPELEFTFMWYPPSPTEEQAAAQQLQALLYRPASTPFQHQQLQKLLYNPAVKNQLELETLIKAIQIRKGKEDGRLAIVQYLNAYFPKEEKLLQHYRKLLFKKDYQALADLSAAPAIWDDRFLEPIISWFQQGNSGAMFHIMDMMYAHRKNWIQKEAIATIFSDLILYRYEEIIYKHHTELSDRELLVWSSAAQLLGKTGNPEVKEILSPFLRCKTRIVPKDFTLTPHNGSIPPPLRITDVALEGLLQLEGIDLEKTYRETGYAPPYASEEAEGVITGIRDGLIGRF